jgi:hypothetical protein
VCIALVVTREGIPLSYEVFDGNRVDVTTVKEIVETMEARFGLAGRIWVMDRGMMSRKNLAWLQQSNRRYVLGSSRSEVKRWSSVFAEEQGWQVVREGVEVKLCQEGSESFVLCRSQDRRRKETATRIRVVSLREGKFFRTRLLGCGSQAPFIADLMPAASYPGLSPGIFVPFGGFGDLLFARRRGVSTIPEWDLTKRS